MKLFISTAIACSALLAGCQSLPEVISSKESLLSAAGFTAKPAVTVAQQEALKSLPANKLIQQDHDGKMIYLYADPVDCQCIYTGNAEAYSKYNQMIFQQNLADEQQLTATMNENPFDFGPWGGYWGY